MTSFHLAALLRAAVFRRGSNPGSSSLHSLRSGGATALYQATKDVESVARFGRWKAKSISAYLRESHQMLAGLSDRMVSVSHTLHFLPRGGESPYGSPIYDLHTWHKGRRNRGRGVEGNALTAMSFFPIIRLTQWSPRKFALPRAIFPRDSRNDPKV